MKHLKFTLLGLFISYFSIILIGAVLKWIHGGPLNDGWTIVRELLTLLMAVALIGIVKKKERLPLSSIGLSVHTWKQTAVWSVFILVLLLAGALSSLMIIQAVGGTFGSSEPKVPLSWLTTALIIIRAGVAEELFFRGYIIERLHFLLKNKWAAMALSLLPFALFHYQQGIWGIFMSLVLGAILTATYVWKRNLQANIIAHFLIDFIPNVLLPLVS